MWTSGLGLLIGKFCKFLTVICPPPECGGVLSFHVFICPCSAYHSLETTEVFVDRLFPCQLTRPVIEIKLSFLIRICFHANLTDQSLKLNIHSWSPLFLTSDYIKMWRTNMSNTSRQHFCSTRRNNTKCWVRQAWANSVDPDQKLQNVASDQGLFHLTSN